MAFLFIKTDLVYTGELNKNSVLNNKIVSLNTKIKNDEIKYKNTIMKIVKNVKMTDSYLFMGGASNKEEDFNLKSYEKVLTHTNNFTELLKNSNNFFDNRTDYYKDLPNIWPLFSTHNIIITSGFGDRFDPFTGKISLVPHEGIDLVTRYGDPVIATADGIVVDHWIMNRIYGRYVIIQHKHNIKTYYAHMSKVVVHEGQKVVKGEVIGYLGDSGHSTGPHLHYGISQDGVYKDPILFLREQSIKKK